MKNDNQGSSGGLTIEDFEDDAIDAELRGFEVVPGTPTTLLIDLDTSEAKERFRTYFPRIQRHYGLTVVSRLPSKTPGHEHVTVSTDRPLAVPERLLLATCLGGDPMVAVMGLRRFENGVENPCRFFRPKRVSP